MKHNPFRKRTGILPSYFTGRENELNELIKDNRIIPHTKEYEILNEILK